jgi:hypothetical protein
MTAHFPAHLSWKLLLATAILVPAARATAADPSNASDASAASGSNNSTGVDFFAAIRNGDLDVKFIPRDSRRAQVLIKNNTDQPLSVKLPDAFVGIPVLAQANGVGGNGNRNTTTNNNNKNNQNQSVGGGMGGQVGGAFSVPPERVVKLQVAVVCLNYGKPDPSPHVPYTIVSAETYTSDPELREVIRMLGDGQMDQRTAQIAAWHVANHMSWDELADLKLNPGLPQPYVRPFFSVDEIHAAMGVVSLAIKQADARQAPSSATSSASASTAASSAGSAGLLPVKN